MGKKKKKMSKIFIIIILVFFQTIIKNMKKLNKKHRMAELAIILITKASALSPQ